jgi:hypothetical protein
MIGSCRLDFVRQMIEWKKYPLCNKNNWVVNVRLVNNNNNNNRPHIKIRGVRSVKGCVEEQVFFFWKLIEYFFQTSVCMCTLETMSKASTMLLWDQWWSEEYKPRAEKNIVLLINYKRLLIGFISIHLPLWPFK